MTVLNDITINGSGSSGGGSFDKVVIRGDGTITTHLETKSFKSYGSSRVQGNLSTETFSNYGECTVNGDLNAQDIKILGTLSIGGQATLATTKVRGTLETDQSWKGENADIKGAITVEGDLELETLLIKGSLVVKGMLNADRIDLQLKFNESKVGEMGGESIHVRRKATFPFVPSEGILNVSLIEGDEIHLEYTHAEVVRGKRVTIGKGCDIGVVEYTDSFKEHGNPTIGDTKKV